MSRHQGINIFCFFFPVRGGGGWDGIYLLLGIEAVDVGDCARVDGCLRPYVEDFVIGLRDDNAGERGVFFVPSRGGEAEGWDEGEKEED